jgi:hypothetical protein
MHIVARELTIPTGELSESYKDLTLRFGRRLLPTLISRRLDGRKSATFAELILELRLWRKRRSVARAAVTLTVDSLRRDGFIPSDFTITE